jgi:hypothetical protein
MRIFSRLDVSLARLAQLFVVVVFACSSVLFLGVPAWGFARAQEGLYFSKNGKTVIVLGLDGKAQGILIIHLKTPTDAQGFDLRKLSLTDCSSVFLQFSSGKDEDQFDKLVVGTPTGSRSVRIRGNFELSMGDKQNNPIEINLDKQLSYVTISSEGSLIGFLGTKKVVNTDNREYAAIVEANGFAPSREPYSLSDAGDLTFKGKEAKFIGIDDERPRSGGCRDKKKSRIISSSTLNQIRAAAPDDRPALLETALKKSESEDALADVIVVRDEPNIVGIDIATDEIVTVRPVTNRAREGITVCVKESISDR